MRGTALYGVLGSLVLAAVAAAPAGSASPAHAPGGGTRQAQGTPEAEGTVVAAKHAAATGITFGSCPDTQDLPAPIECGTVTVPLDYAHPDGRQLKLSVSRLRASGEPAAHQGALVFNPGGPGASGMDFPLYAGLPEWRRLADAYDFVGYAPRGVGGSAPLSCQDPAEFAKAPTSSREHPSQAYKESRKARAAAYAAGCAARTGPSLRHYTSLNNARDLEVIRAALGERRLNFIGASYGTYFGALYATLFPGHVRRMVFDSAVDPDPRKIWYGSNLDQSRAFERRWSDWRTWVAKHDAVYHLGRTPQQVLRNYRKAQARLERRPAGGKVGTAQLQAAFLLVGYYDSYWPWRAQALSEYLRGNPNQLIQQAAPHPEEARTEENGNAVYTAVECNDAPWPRSWRTWDQDNTELARTAPFEAWDNAWLNLPCAYWTQPRQRPLDVRTAPGVLPPVLILAAERDAATPYEGALRLQRRLSGASLVTERGAGTHGIAGGPNACVNRHLETYLLHGRTPGPRAYCGPRAEPLPSRAQLLILPKAQRGGRPSP